MSYFFVAGFDFGTSHSKVVLREQRQGVAKAVTFGEAGEGLFPSFVRISKHTLAGPESGQGDLVLSYPKLIAADAASGRQEFSSLYGDRLDHIHKLLGTTTLEQVASLALTRYFLSVLNAIHEFIRNDPDWATFAPATDLLVVQLAVPTGLSASGGAVDKMMQSALAAATHLRAKSPSAASVTSVKDLLSALLEIQKMDPDSRETLDQHCITYPEVAAGVQTVLRSPNSMDGKYITLDVGAGTVDLNAFLRRSVGTADAESRNPGLDYWACEVRPLGFARLDLSASHHASHTHEVTVNPLKAAELFDQFRQAIEHLMSEAFRFQPNRIDGNGGSPWTRNIIAYIWGGGAEYQPYEATLLTALQSLRVGIHHVNRLPVPNDKFRLPEGVNFGRLAIAYGLSYYWPNLEAVRLPAQLRTFDEIYPDYWQELVPSSRLCSCRANPACVRCHGTGLITRETPMAIVTGGTHPPPASPSAVATPKPSRYHLALDCCILDYHKLPRPPKGGRIVERTLLLNYLQRLSTRPEIHEDDGLMRDAKFILQYTFSNITGRVRAVRYSGLRTPRGCRCVVIPSPDGTPIDVEIYADSPNALKAHVNQDAATGHVDFACTISRTVHKQFVLYMTSTEPPAPPRPPQAKTKRRKSKHRKKHKRKSN